MIFQQGHCYCQEDTMFYHFREILVKSQMSSHFSCSVQIKIIVNQVQLSHAVSQKHVTWPNKLGGYFFDMLLRQVIHYKSDHNMSVFFY